MPSKYEEKRPQNGDYQSDQDAHTRPPNRIRKKKRRSSQSSSSSAQENQTYKPRTNHGGKELRVVLQNRENIEMARKKTTTQRGKRPAQDSSLQDTTPPKAAKTSGSASSGKKKQTHADKDKEIAELKRKLELAEESQKQAEESQKQPAETAKESTPVAPIALEKFTYGRGNRRSNVQKSAHQVSIPTGLMDEVKEYVTFETWKDVKFLGTPDEVIPVCDAIIKALPQFSKLRSEDANVYQENLAQMFEIYGGEILKTINQRRTAVTNDLRKAWVKRALSGETMPTPSQMKQVIYRKGMEKVEVPKFDPEEKPKEGASAKEFEAFKLKKQAYDQAIEHNKEADLLFEFFLWYWTALLQCVCTKHRWGASIRSYATISQACQRDDPSKKFVTDSDEAFVLITIENCAQRFKYHVQCKENGTDPVKNAKENRTKWVDDRIGQKKWGGWSNEGRKRFVGHVFAIAKNKRKAHVPNLEKDALNFIRGDKKSTKGGEESEGEEEDDYGGEDGKASFLGRDMSTINYDEIDSDMESLPEEEEEEEANDQNPDAEDEESDKEGQESDPEGKEDDQASDKDDGAGDQDEEVEPAATE